MFYNNCVAYCNTASKQNIVDKLETYVPYNFWISASLHIQFSLVTCMHQTEVIKGPCGSVGMTFRHVPASEGDAVHVSIETVTPNSPAALADLQRGDRLIAIGGLRCVIALTVHQQSVMIFMLFLKFCIIVI